ncbi:TPA: hypothetical protein ACK3JW_000897 [Mannheimia haemolytica]
MNREYAKLGALLHLQEKNTDPTLDLSLEAYIKTTREALRNAIKNHDKNGLTDAEIEKLVENISKEEFENKSPYDLAREFIENKTQAQEQQQVASLSTPTPKITQGEETFDEKVTRLMKEGLSLGQIKEAHPELDVLVPKEFEAEALGRNNTTEQAKNIEVVEQNEFGLNGGV